MSDLPSEVEESTAVDTVVEGQFEVERRVSAGAAGEFLSSVGEAIATDDGFALTGADWRLPFAFEEPVTVEVEFDGDGEPVLEIEAELSGRTAPDDA